MDLRTGQCFWPLIDGLTAVYPPLEADASCDTAIVGGGITGALVAHRLAHEGRDCILLDKRDIAWGSTLASTALLQYEIDAPLLRLAERIGARDAARAYTLCHNAIDELEGIISRLPANVAFERRRSLFLSKDGDDQDALRRECAARAAAGIPVRYLDARALRERFGADRPGALLSDSAAQLDPFRLTHALLADAAPRGLRAFDRSPVVACERHARGVLLRTARGPTVAARAAVFATGYEARAALKHKFVDLKSTYCLVTEPLERFWPERCLVWESGTPYFYLRSTPDGRAMMGGEDLPFRSPLLRDLLIPAKVRTRIARFHDLFPHVRAEPAFAWAGTFGDTRDGLGYCAPSPELPGALFALGFGGNGTTFAVIFARLIADMLAGRPCDDARLFRFDR